jgi:serine/threonine-protein kinase
MGEVYRADDLTLDQTVALKFLPARVTRDARNGADVEDAERLAQFHGELRIARQVSHKNVCRLYDLGEANGRRFLTMEYVDGEDLGALLRRIGRFPQDRAIAIARQLCAGVAAAHERGVIHRDLKPANVMIDGEGNVRITDFGIAIAATASADSSAGLAGTPQYMAPEQLAGSPASVESDIYALGLILFEIFTGKRAYDAKTINELKALHDTGTVTTPSSIVHDLDPAVERIIVRSLDRDPAKRPASAIAVAAALPGADPVAAALAAGETPSPDLLAAAAETDAMSLPLAGGLAAAFALGLAVFAAIAPRATVSGLTPLEKPPAVLADRAEQILASVGYAAADEADHDSGFAFASDYLQWVESSSQSPNRWDELSSARPGAIVYCGRGVSRAAPRAVGPCRPSCGHSPGAVVVGRAHGFVGDRQPSRVDGQHGDQSVLWGAGERVVLGGDSVGAVSGARAVRAAPLAGWTAWLDAAVRRLRSRPARRT